MKRAALITLFFFWPLFALASPAASDYTVDIHVSSTRMLRLPGATGRSQQLDVLIDGKKFQLQSEGMPSALLALGDYKAKLVKNEHWRGATYDLYQVYEFLLPDNRTRRFVVVGQSE